MNILKYDKIEIMTKSEAHKLGLDLGKTLKAGSIIALIGEIGSGKTTLTQAIAQGLGIEGYVKSPTFNIMNIHEGGRLPLYHFDAYRLGDSDDFYEIGYEEYFYGKGISVIEWADIVEDILPEDAIVIKISYTEDREKRKYEIIGY